MLSQLAVMEYATQMKILRILATGFCFAFFSIGGFLYAITYLAAISLFCKDQADCRRKTQKAISASFRVFVKLMELVRVVKVTTVNTEVLKQDDGVIYIANHPSLIDVVLMGSVVERFDCIVKASLWDSPLTKWVVRAADFIPNTAAGEVIQDCKKRLDDGGVLIIFPEGTRTVPGEELKLQRGAAQIAVRTGAPIRLFHLNCHPPLLAKGHKWSDVPDKCPQFEVKVGELIDTAALCREYPEPSLAARKLTRLLKEKLEQELT